MSGVAPFSATVSWQPPLEDGGAAGPLMYTVTLTNTLNGSDVTTFSPTPALVMELTDLRHSVPYGVQVVAGNEAGMGPTMCTVALYTPPPQYSAGYIAMCALFVCACIIKCTSCYCNRKLSRCTTDKYGPAIHMTVHIQEACMCCVLHFCCHRHTAMHSL